MGKKLNLLVGVILTLILVSGLNAQIPGAEYLTHHWSFEDGTANDEVGDADGTLIGGATVTNGSLVLNELGDWMEMSGETIALLVYDEMTMAGWFSATPDVNDNFHMLAFFGDSLDGLGSNGLFYSPERGDDVSRIAISCGETVQPWTVESGANGPEIQDGDMHHFVGVFSSTEVSYYLDGILQESVPMDAHNSLYFMSTNCAFLGRGGYRNDPSFRGMIHEFSIFNKALNADEAVILYGIGPQTTAVEDNNAVPETFALSQNYPNPFNPSTEISYTLTRNGHVSLNVFNTAGENVATLANEVQSAGEYRVSFNAGDLANGVYYYRLQTDDGVISKRMVLMK